MATKLNSLLDTGRFPKLVFLGDGPAEELDPVNFGQRIAPLVNVLTAQFRPGDRVGIMYGSEPMLVLSWLAALHAGLEPLILHYPNAKQNLATWKGSICHIVRTVRLAGIVCSPRLEPVSIPDCRVLYLTERASMQDISGLFPSLLPTAPILQMSSGTTGHRKPIRFTLEQIAAHAGAFSEMVRLDSEDRIVSWLPLYHDMGFIACFIMPLMLGIPVIMMDPMAWVREPKRLFQAINCHQATTCYMPNFGFEVMAKHAQGQACPTMRRWISCSEPVYPATMERFAAATGTAREQLASCYAMAENVFAVTYRDGFRALEFEGRLVASCGRTIPGTLLKLVDGEIWVRSPSSLTAYLDGAPVVDDAGFYPTGDLGELIDDELVVIGRKHDLLNVAGKKYMLSDLDQAIGRVLPTLHEGRAATLARRNADIGTELPLFLVEDRDFYLRTDIDGIRTRLSAEIDLESCSIEFVPPGFLTKTSSGKISRPVTLANYEAVRLCRESLGEPVIAPSIDDEFLRLFGSVPHDQPVLSILDSLGLVCLSTLMEGAGLALLPAMSLDAHLAALKERRGDPIQRRPGADSAEHIAIVSLADSRTIAGITKAHLEMLSEAAGVPVTLEHVCLPPSPVLLSDLVFFEYFLPRDRSEKYDAVIAALSKVRNASVLLIDDIAELLFGRFAYPALNHRFERSAAADLLVWRWQKYIQRHHELPISVVNLWETQSFRNEFIRRLSHYLGVPIFRIATLKSFSEFTAGWEYVDRSNADWTTKLDVNPDAIVSRLGAFLQAERFRIPPRFGSVELDPQVQDLPHFCSMYVDIDKLEDVLSEHRRFCLVGPESSAPYVRKRIRDLGKHYMQTNNLNLHGQGYSDDDFDCVLQLGSWGRVDTAKPVFQIFSGGWDPNLQPATVKDRLISDTGWFHANLPSAPNEMASEKSILWSLSHPESTDRRSWQVRR